MLVKAGVEIDEFWESNTVGSVKMNSWIDWF